MEHFTDKVQLQAVPIHSKKIDKLSSFLLPVVVLLIVIIIWCSVRFFHLFPAYALPSSGEVLNSFKEEIATGRLVNDIITSLCRVAVGFVLVATLGIPLGLSLGHYANGRQSFVPLLNFFRFLSPLAWTSFAILWFHIGDKPAIFLILPYKDCINIKPK